ncbi:hypothetical protein HYDPIDRAFT_115945 [Hydnomerulius pinastri MD-312]|uniref:Uncharacterized protein n=1 Tax=Hydnomerulius pinastri MD-312 TaxID=994086 RepID=A0A0C9WBT0_9AGAM|nr:hypothetical protein HYDPIDRAFT_115945 [Hydnomerulius pinastri MD-312]
MAPRRTTNSTVGRSSPGGRQTRNSLYGRPAPASPKPHKSAKGKGKATSVSDEMEGVDSDDMNIDYEPTEERAFTPPPVAGPSSSGGHYVPHTPMPRLPFDAGSVILTPVKRGKPLQASPTRIGDKGIRCLYEQGGDVRGPEQAQFRLILPHPVGSSANLSREQVQQLERAQESRIFQEQIRKLLDQKRQLEAEEATFQEEEEEHYSDSGYEEEMDTDQSPVRRRVITANTNGTIFVNPGEVEGTARAQQMETRGPSFIRGPNGEMLDRQGRQMFGREGTVLVDSTFVLPRRLRQPLQEVPTEILNHPDPDERVGIVEFEGVEWEVKYRRLPNRRNTGPVASGSSRPVAKRLGPEGTELI